MAVSAIVRPADELKKLDGWQDGRRKLLENCWFEGEQGQRQWRPGPDVGTVL